MEVLYYTRLAVDSIHIKQVIRWLTFVLRKSCNMKKALLIAGIVLIAACVLCLGLAAWNLFAYHHVLDGSAELYGRLHRLATIFFWAGAALALTGAACLIVRAKI